MPTNLHGRVLVVDDDPAIRAFARDALEAEGYDVCEAADGVQGLAQLSRSRAALVVLVDMCMPHMDGEQMLRAAISSRGDQRCLAYVLWSANLSLVSPACVRFLAAQHIPLLEKSCDLDRLLATIDRAQRQLARHQLGTAAQAS
jgi:DNA-binding NtrC family response regulator